MFEEFIAQGNDMIRRQQRQIGLSAYSEAEIHARYVNLWRRIVAYLVELEGRLAGRGQVSDAQDSAARKAG